MVDATKILFAGLKFIARLGHATLFCLLSSSLFIKMYLLFSFATLNFTTILLVGPKIIAGLGHAS